MGPARLFRAFARVYPPFAGPGYRITHLTDDFRTLEVAMPLRWWNRNYVGTQFGGSLYSMCDPWFMLILLWQVGDRAVVWDKAATIRFRRPGTGRVRARFHIDDDRLAAIEARLEREDRFEEHFTVRILDDDDRIVAEVDKVVHLRRKSPR